MKLGKYITELAITNRTPVGGRTVNYIGQGPTGLPTSAPPVAADIANRAKELRLQGAGPNSFYKQVTNIPGGGRQVAYNVNTPAGLAAGKAAAIPSPLPAAPVANPNIAVAKQGAGLGASLLAAHSGLAGALGGGTLGAIGATALPIAAVAGGALLAKKIYNRVNPNARQAILAKKLNKMAAQGKDGKKGKKIEKKLRQSIEKHGNRLAPPVQQPQQNLNQPPQTANTVVQNTQAQPLPR